jgi:CRP-like cAMP-binding protein
MAVETRLFKSGQIIFFAGMSGDEAFLIRDGRVQVFVTQDGSERVLTTLGPGDILGEMALVDGRPRSASARAVSVVTAAVLPRKLILAELERTPGIIRTIVNAYIQIIRRQNHK